MEGTKKILIRLINKILRKVNDLTVNGSRITGVHIRNLFTYRTPYPRDLVEAFADQLARLQEAEDLNEDDLDWELDTFGCSILEDDVVPAEWVERADDCALVLLAWGNCGGSSFQEIKNQVFLS